MRALVPYAGRRGTMPPHERFFTLPENRATVIDATRVQVVSSFGIWYDRIRTTVETFVQ